MENFKLARFKLTAWYVIIIAVISIIFSVVIYRDVTAELDRTYGAFEYSIQAQPGIFVPNRATAIAILSEDLAKAKHVVLLRLLTVNGFILFSSAIIAYFLAGKTLHPIEVGLKKQKQFIADASHELKTPLTALRSEIEVALRQKTITQKQTTQLLKSNLEEIVKMQYLTNYLLLLSRYDSEQKINFELVNLTNAIEDAVYKHKVALKNKKIKLKINPSSITVRGVSSSITELISILLDNAIKYSDKNKTIWITTKIKRRHVVIQIKDQGVGIRQSDIPYIFNRFYRVDSSRKSDGYGLGLAIAKSIVDMHGGTIDVTSEIGKGSMFSVILPRG